MKDLGFEVEAVPQVNKGSSATSSTPLNVKIRIRNKSQNKNVRQGIISIPKISGQVYPCEKIRLSSSDQTIMSFNVIMEEDKSGKRPMQKKKRIFHIFKRGGCFGIRNDDDEDEEFYTKRQSFELITTLSTNAMDNQNLTLTKNLDNAKTQQTNKITQKDFLGKCKPGGCLDPPFGEDKYSYIPKLIDISESKKDLSELEKNKDQDETSLINIINVKAEGESGYNADYKKENIKSSYPADSNFINIKKSNSIITYPSTSSSTELFSTSDKIHKKIKKDRKSKDNGLSNLPNEFIETYYISPKKTKKTNNLEESNGNIVKFNKEEKSPKITLSHLHLDIQDAITCNHMAQSHVQNTSTRVDAIEEMQPILNVSKVKLDDQVKIGTDINKLSGKSLSQPDCGSNKNIKNIEAIICHEGNSNNLLNCTAVSAIAGDTVFRGSDSNICSIINDTPNNSYLTLLNKDTNDRNPLDYDTKQPLKDIKSLSMDKKHSINNNFRNMIEFQSTVLKTQDNHYECDRVKAATNELICIINKSQSKNTENNFKTKALVSLTTEAIESNLLPKSNSETENKNLDISDTKKITSVTTFISKQDKIERSKIENEISNDISPQPIMQDKIDSNIKDYKMSLNKLNTTDSKNSKDLLISPVTIDHKVDIEKQKEHISSECKSVHEKPIEKDTAHNNYFTSISYKEKLHNNIIPQTKLDGEVKSINESILYNNIDKGSLTSLKETALITDNIQNISAQDHKVDIEKQKERISPECKSVLENPIETNTANNNSFARISDKENLYNNIIPQTKLDDEIKSINEPILFNNINKVSLTSVKGTKLITDNIQNISDQDHKVDIENQKEHIPPECISVIEKPIEIDTAHNNSFTRMSDKEKMLNDFIPQTKLNDEVKSNQESILCNNINKVSLTSVKEATLITDNIQNISDQDHNVDIEKQKEHISPESISVIEKPIDTADNNSFTRIKDKEKLYNYIIPQTKLEQDEVKSIQESILCNNINKVSLTSVKEATLITDNIQNISDQDHKVDIEKQKEHISPESISVIEKPIDTADNNSFTRIKDKENLYNYIIPQTKLEQDEVKSIQESILFNNINKVSLTSLKETTLITDNIQNISDQDHKVDIEKQKEHISPESISVIEKPIDTADNNSFTRIKDKEKLYNYIIPQTKLEQDEVKSINESILCNNINKVSLTSVKEATLITDNIQNISDQDHKEDIKKQKEHISPESISVIEKPIDTANNNSFTRISDKEKLYNYIIPQTKLEQDEVKSFQESILFNNINKVSLTSLKETTLITDNIQNISDQDHKVDIENQKEHISPECISVIEKSIEIDTTKNNYFTRMSDKEKLLSDIIPQTKLNDEVKSKQELNLFNNINKVSLTSVKEATLITDNIQNISDQDHKLDIVKQKEHVSPECKSVLEIPIETDTAHNNSLTKIIDKENLQNNFITQTKLDHEVKSINESILCNNIDKGSSTSLKKTTLITDNIQNISDKEIKNIIKSNTSRNNLNSKCDLSLNQNNSLSTNETTLATENFPIIDEQVIQNITIPKVNGDQTHSKSALSLNKSNLYPTKENTLFPYHIQEIRDRAIQNISMSQSTTKSESLAYLHKNEDILPFTKNTTLDTSNLEIVEDQIIQNKRQTIDQIHLIPNKNNATPTKETYLDSNNVKDISDKVIQNIDTLKPNRRLTDFKSGLPDNQSDFIPTRKSNLVYGNVQNNSDISINQSMSDQAIQSIPILQANRSQINSKSDLSLKQSKLTLTKDSNSQYFSDQTSQNINILRLNRDEINSKSDLLQNKEIFTPIKGTNFDKHNFQTISYQAIQNITTPQSNRNEIKSDLSPNESNVISSRKTTSVESNVQNIRDQVNKKIDLKSDLSVNESNLTSTSETTLEKSNIQNIADQSVQMITKSNGNKNQMYSSSKILLNKGNLSLLKSTTLLNNDIQNISDQAIQNIAQSQTNRNQIDSNKDSSIDETSLILTSLNKIEKLQRKTVGTKNISPKIKPKTSFNEENDKKISLKETSQNNLQGAIEVQFKNNVSATNEDNNNIKQSTHKTNIVKDIIYLDLKFQTCGVDKNKNVVRTLDTALFDNSYQLLGDNILHIKTLIRVDDNEIRIPIDADKDLSLKITKPKGKFSHKNRMNGNLSDPRNMLSSKQKSDEIGVFLNNQRINKTVNAKVSTKIKDSTKSAENLQDTLCSIYQEKLLPLHETLRNLIGDVDGLAEQQSIIIDKLHKENEIQANRIPNKNKACGCNSNYNIKVINSLN